MRSVESVALLHAVSESLAVSAKRELALLLVRLSRASDASLQRIRLGTTVSADLTKRLIKTRDEALRNALLDLLTELARYDLAPEELVHLLDLAADATLDPTLKVRVLHRVALIADRETPPAHWR